MVETACSVFSPPKPPPFQPPSPPSPPDKPSMPPAIPPPRPMPGAPPSPPSPPLPASPTPADVGECHPNCLKPDGSLAMVESCRMFACHRCTECRRLPFFVEKSAPCWNKPLHFRFCSKWCAPRSNHCTHCECQTCSFCTHENNGIPEPPPPSPPMPPSPPPPSPSPPPPPPRPPCLPPRQPPPPPPRAPPFCPPISPPPPSIPPPLVPPPPPPPPPLPRRPPGRIDEIIFEPPGLHATKPPIRASTRLAPPSSSDFTRPAPPPASFPPSRSAMPLSLPLPPSSLVLSQTSSHPYTSAFPDGSDEYAFNGDASRVTENSVPFIVAPVAEDPSKKSHFQTLSVASGLAAAASIVALLFCLLCRRRWQSMDHLDSEGSGSKEELPDADETSAMLCRKQPETQRRNLKRCVEEHSTALLECEAEWLRMDDDEQGAGLSNATCRPNHAFDLQPTSPQPSARSLAAKQALAEVNTTYEHLILKSNVDTAN